jgi:hypothetical protein
MQMGRAVVLAVGWAMSLVGVGLWAQNRPLAPAPVIEGPGFAPPPKIILSGDNLGFQTALPVQTRSGQGARYLRGALMVRVNGEWVYAEVYPGHYPYVLGTSPQQ